MKSSVWVPIKCCSIVSSTQKRVEWNEAEVRIPPVFSRVSAYPPSLPYVSRKSPNLLQLMLLHVLRLSYVLYTERKFFRKNRLAYASVERDRNSCVNIEWSLVDAILLRLLRSQESYRCGLMKRPFSDLATALHISSIPERSSQSLPQLSTS